MEPTRVADEPTVQTQNDRGEWVESIPLPFYLGSVLPTRRTTGSKAKCRCQCGRKFPDEETYRGHYALVHILGLS